MKKETLIKEIREKVIASNLEIVELQQGCEVEITRRITEHEYTDFEVGDRVWVNSSSWSICALGILHKDDFKIIGRPIRQDDIALILNDTNKCELAMIWENGYLDTQSEKTLNWIADNAVALPHALKARI